MRADDALAILAPNRRNGPSDTEPDVRFPQEGGPRDFPEDLPTFMERVSRLPEPGWIIPGLVPEDGIALLHGQPRDGKSLVAVELLLALALGDAPFGLERLRPREAMPAGYFGEEDAERRVYQRIRGLLAGRELSDPPWLLHLSIRRGVELDSPEWREAITEAVQREGLRLVVLDPLRSFTGGADQGPRELRPAALFLRRLMTEAGCALLLVHHDTKPRGDGKPDDRKRPQKASGGGVFSISDAPIHVERLDPERTLLAPTGYKFGADPQPLVYRFCAGAGDSIRLEGEDVTVGSADALALTERVESYLAEHPKSSGSAVARGLGKGKDDVLAALRALHKAGRVDCLEKGRGRATEWSLRGPEVHP